MIIYWGTLLYSTGSRQARESLMEKPEPETTNHEGASKKKPNKQSETLEVLKME